MSGMLKNNLCGIFGHYFEHYVPAGCEEHRI